MNSSKFSKHLVAGLALAAAGLSMAGTARADGWPSSAAGSWKITANQSFYCPGSGRIAFRRVNATQTYVGNLSQSGTVNRMAGTWESLGGSFGEYAFYATK
jgi:hypothetical protein